MKKIISSIQSESDEQILKERECLREDWRMYATSFESSKTWESHGKKMALNMLVDILPIFFFHIAKFLPLYTIIIESFLDLIHYANTVTFHNNTCKIIVSINITTYTKTACL